MPAILPHLHLLPVLLGIGALGGFLSGLLGIGGGAIFVPALFFFFKSAGLDGPYIMHVAIGTSLAAVLATSLTSARHHAKRGAVDMGIVRRWGAFIVIGVLLGGLFAASVEGRTLKEIFAALMLIMAPYIAFSKDKAAKNADGKEHLPRPAQYGLCLITGALSSMIGVGGAVMNVPMMLYSGVGVQRAIGTGAALASVIALPGVLFYVFAGLPYMAETPPYSLGYLNIPAAASIIIISMFVAPWGVRVAHKLPTLLLRRIFAMLLAVVAIRMLSAI